MRRSLRKQILNFLILIIIFKIQNTSALNLKLTKLVCNVVDESFSKIEICRVKAVSRNEQFYTLHLKLLQLPINDINLRMRFMKKANGFKPFLYDFTFKCDFIKHLNAVTTIVWRWFMESTNLNHSCPLTEDFIIPRLTNLYFQKQLSVLPIVSGDYAFFAHFSAYNKSRFLAEFHVTAY